MTDRFVCVHGHFYQPPRENPWLESVDPEDSAAPFHDWNARIAEECYAPNTAARILDEQGRICRIVNNFSRISFNVGPTLMSWLRRHHPETLAAMIAADQAAQARFSGHGSAIAQVYNHLIMPLANRRDKITQIRWGIDDFRTHFGRMPEGMWLAETAVDTETLELLAEAGIRFTILAPHQARQVRKIGDVAWQTPKRLATGQPYRCLLPSGREIAIFFYNGALASDVAFGDLLKDGGRLARQIVQSFSRDAAPQLAHFATDGETFGHHHRFGEMALAYCLDHIEQDNQAELTVYGAYLEKFPPTQEVRIRDNTSWSCAHGIERWRSDCGCRIDLQRNWRQNWRAPLRAALDWLRDELADLFVAEAAQLFPDPWQTRDEYIAVLLDRTQARAFLTVQAKRPLDQAETMQALGLLEMQRQAMAMYTSCGWFFDDVAGLESQQILRFAARALHLAADAGQPGLVEPFLQRLALAPSNDPQWRDARHLFEERILANRVDLAHVAAHHAIATGFSTRRQPSVEPLAIHCYQARERQLEQHVAEGARLCLGLVEITSGITFEQGTFLFAVLHIGGYSLNAGLLPYRDDAHYTAFRSQVLQPFRDGDVAEVLLQLDRQFGAASYNLWHLFADERRSILDRIMSDTLHSVENEFRAIHDRHLNMLRFLRDLNVPLPPQLTIPVGSVLNSDLQRALSSHPCNIKVLHSAIEEALSLGVELDKPALTHAVGRRIAELLDDVAAAPQDRGRLDAASDLLELLDTWKLPVDLWRAQTRFFELFGGQPALAVPAEAVALAEWLKVRLE
jgi:alpha-amylase/alpha-mannosidase (GH57 family)